MAYPNTQNSGHVPANTGSNAGNAKAKGSAIKGKYLAIGLGLCALPAIAVLAMVAKGKPASTSEDKPADTGKNAGKTAREISDEAAAKVRSDMAKKAAKARWDKKKKPEKEEAETVENDT